VRNAIGTVRHKLPLEMREPVLQRVDPSAQPIMQLALSSTRQNHAEISRLAEDQLADRFRGIPGVAIVNVNGSLRRELSVLLRAEKLREYNVSVTEVVNAVRSQNATAPVGKVRGTLEDQSIRLVGRIESPAEFEQIVIRARGNESRAAGPGGAGAGRLRRADRLQRAQRPAQRRPVDHALARREHGVGGRRGAQAGRRDQQDAAAGHQLEVTQDGGERRAEQPEQRDHALVFGAGLTIFVVYVFLNSWRSTLITALSLPTSVIAAFIAVWLCGFTLNFMSLLGLSLAIGVLIDDAIVVRRTSCATWSAARNRRDAALNGTAEIGLAVAATTFSIVAVFVPGGLHAGVSGEWFRPFALTVVASVLVSLFISFTLDPMLSAFWGDPPGHHHAPKNGISKLLARFNTWFDHQADRYGNVIAWALHHRIWMWCVRQSAASCWRSCCRPPWAARASCPASDAGVLRSKCARPSSSSLEYGRPEDRERRRASRARCQRPRRPTAT
jgi:HAE1 family hydrophobic/amphiphilic exporter-1